MTVGEPSIVQEVTHVLREWGAMWKQRYKVSEFMFLNEAMKRTKIYKTF